MTKDRLVYRHRLWVRVTHWVNAICMTVLVMSGLQIFNAHPALYWGAVSGFDTPSVALGPFPAWATLPGTEWLAMGRRWHFFFAWLFVVNASVYALLAIIRGHLAAIWSRQRQNYDKSPVRAASICDCASQRAKRQSTTMYCRGSPISE